MGCFLENNGDIMATKYSGDHQFLGAPLLADPLPEPSEGVGFEPTERILSVHKIPYFSTTEGK
jgi:hypothetical protein